MEAVFVKLLNMSIAAGWLVLAVVVLRLLLKKAPKTLRCVLWALVAVRLVCPFSIESALSLIPRGEPVSQETLIPAAPTIENGTVVWVPNGSAAAIEPAVPLPERWVSPAAVAAWVWVVGMAALAVYALVSYAHIRRRVREAVVWRDNVWLCDRVATPFILGLVRPRIFLPSAMNETDREYVIAHEQAHLQRRDHWWKPLGFVLLTVYWFNPLMWVAYILLCRDIELACDERVIRQLGAECKKPYADALINCSVPRRAIAACPLAFGEVGVKARIKTVLNYKKPAFWIVLVAIIACVAVAVCFLTDPKVEPTDKPSSTVKGIIALDGGSELSGVSLEITGADLTGESPYIEITWKNEREDTIFFGEPFAVYYKDGGEWVDCWRGEDRVWIMPAYLIAPNGKWTKRYSLTGLDMSATGRYRFVSDCDIEGQGGADAEGNYEDYEVWVEFELTEGIATPYTYEQLLSMVEEIVSAEEAAASSNSYDYIRAKQEVYDAILSGGDVAVACFVGELKRAENDGLREYIMAAACSEITGLGRKGDSDVSSRLWGTGAEWLSRYYGSRLITAGSPVHHADNTVHFFEKSTMEGQVATIQKTASVSDSQMQALFSMLKAQTWHDDSMVDRVQFWFDGVVAYQEGIYFGYESGVVYYDHYFCELSESDMQRFQEMESRAVECLIPD